MPHKHIVTVKRMECRLYQMDAYLLDVLSRQLGKSAQEVMRLALRQMAGSLDITPAPDVARAYAKGHRRQKCSSG